MSYNNDEQARRAQAAQNNQWASNSSQPQNFAPYQTGTYSDPNEPIIHTTGTVPMNTLNSPSSHSRPVLPYDPTRQSSAAHDPSGRENLLRTTLVRAAYGQGEPSREPLGVGFGAQHPNYYAQAAPYPGPGPSGSQTAQTHPHGLMADSTDPQSALSDRDAERLRAKAKREEKISKGECPKDKNPLAPGKSKCERTRYIAIRIADFNMTSNKEYDYGQSSQDKSKGKETEIVNRFPNPPPPNQNYPRPQMPYRWPTPVITNDNTDNPVVIGSPAFKQAEPWTIHQTVTASFVPNALCILQSCAKSTTRNKTL
ncbi:uncharacterized protein FFMR_06604 [Fusarium fujikuroi]|nr:uncharacterized protein FFMR_06604 [Fusarium fujikuroi]